MMARYHAGRALEHEVRKLFRDAGWDVLRGAGSKGEVFGIKADLVATRQTRDSKRTAVMVIVQCKLESSS